MLNRLAKGFLVMLARVTFLDMLFCFIQAVFGLSSAKMSGVVRVNMSERTDANCGIYRSMLFWVQHLTNLL